MKTEKPYNDNEWESEDEEDYPSDYDISKMLDIIKAKDNENKQC